MMARLISQLKSFRKLCMGIYILLLSFINYINEGRNKEEIRFRVS